VAALTARERPDVALVGLGASSEHALGMIAARRLRRDHRARLGRVAGHLDIVLRRFAEYHDLKSAFASRSTIERAKGVLMERRSANEERAFAMLREQARKARFSQQVPMQLLDRPADLRVRVVSP
jgi:ANTAR domain-containing protein